MRPENGTALSPALAVRRSAPAVWRRGHLRAFPSARDGAVHRPPFRRPASRRRMASCTRLASDVVKRNVVPVGTFAFFRLFFFLAFATLAVDVRPTANVLGTARSETSSGAVLSTIGTGAAGPDPVR